MDVPLARVSETAAFLAPLIQGTPRWMSTLENHSLGDTSGGPKARRKLSSSVASADDASKVVS